MSEIQVKEESVKQLISDSEGNLIQLKDHGESVKKITQELEIYKDFKVTKENLKEAKENRTIIRQKRYDIQNLEKHNINVLNEAKKDLKADNEKLYNLITPIENRFDEEIKAVEAQKKAEKEAKEKLARERVENIKLHISETSSGLNEIYVNAESEEDLQRMKSQLNAFRLSLDTLEEFEFMGEGLIQEFELKIEKLSERLQKRKAEIAEAEKVRLENDRLKQEKKELELQEKERAVQKWTDRSAELIKDFDFELENDSLLHKHCNTVNKSFIISMSKDEYDDFCRKVKIEIESKKIAKKELAEKEAEAEQLRKQNEILLKEKQENERIEDEKKKSEELEKEKQILRDKLTSFNVHKIPENESVENLKKAIKNAEYILECKAKEKQLAQAKNDFDQYAKTINLTGLKKTIKTHLDQVKSSSVKELLSDCLNDVNSIEERIKNYPIK